MRNRDLVERLLQLDPDLPVIVGIMETTDIESVQEERGEERVQCLQSMYNPAAATMIPFHRIRLA